MRIAMPIDKLLAEHVKAGELLPPVKEDDFIEAFLAMREAQQTDPEDYDVLFRVIAEVEGRECVPLREVAITLAPKGASPLIITSALARIAALDALGEGNGDFGPMYVQRVRGRPAAFSEALLRAAAQCPLKPCKDASLADIAFDAAELRGLLIAKAEAGASALPLH
jgi:hypothetical protein